MGKKIRERREMASLTKIMAAYTVLNYCSLKNIELKENTIRVSGISAHINGTAAGLKKGNLLSAFDLLYAMMLPSGNDAARALSEYFGGLLYQDKFPQAYKKPRFPGRFFVGEMNRNARALHMFSTHYNNSHGLANEYNKSTTQDIAILSAAAMKIPLFREIVRTKEYECTILTAKGIHKKVKWENTNMMLNFDGFNGLKTGITPTAGPCLCSSYSKSGVNLIIVLLNCKTIEKRWDETRKLLKFYLKTIKPTENKPKIDRNVLPMIYGTDRKDDCCKEGNGSTNVSSSDV